MYLLGNPVSTELPTETDRQIETDKTNILNTSYPSTMSRERERERERERALPFMPYLKRARYSECGFNLTAMAIMYSEQ